MSAAPAPAPTAKAIVIQWLTENKFDGLYADECGCELSDLVPCGDDFTGCRPGYKQWAPDVTDHEFNIRPSRG